MGGTILEKFLNREKIQQFIPHRGQWLLLDFVIEIRENFIIAEKTFTLNECKGHFNPPIVPGVLICESLMQAGAVLASSHLGGIAKDMIPVVAHINDVRFFSKVIPGEKITLEVEVKKIGEISRSLCALKGTATVGSRRVAKFDAVGTLIAR